MREIIKDWLRKMEFLTGLKQFREMSLEDAKSMIDYLEAKVNEYSWMNESRLNHIFKAGMEGVYGEFYNMNVRTISSWCNTYYEHNKQKIILEQTKSNEAEEVSEEEKQKWLRIGRETFCERWEDAKRGVIQDLWYWGPHYYSKLVEKGVLNESDFQIDESRLVKELRLERGLQFDMSNVVSRKKNIIWKKFIQRCVLKKIDLTEHV